MEETEFNSLTDWERDAHQDDRLFHVGKPIWETLNALEAEGDHHALDNYLLSLSPEQERALRHMSKRNDAIADRIQELLKNGDADEITQFVHDQLLPIDKRVLGPQIQRLKERAAGLQRSRQAPSTAPDLTTDHKARGQDEKKDPPLDVLYKKWVKANQGMSRGSLPEYQRMIEFFIRVLTEYHQGQCPRVSEVDEQMIRDYKEVVEVIPSRVKTHGKSIEQLIKTSGALKSPKTIKGIFTNVGTFLVWVRGEGYPLQNNLHEVLTHYAKIKSHEKKKRVPWDPDDLTTLFHCHEYRTGQWERSSEYWAPLLALFTGCTQSELLQLEVTDIQVNNGIDVININDQGTDKRLKYTNDLDGDGRPRLIPIHQTLKKLGFLDFVEKQDHRGLNRLFPEEERNIRGQFGAYGNRFRTHRDKLGIGPRHSMEYRDFHSFRHLFKTKLSDIELHEGIIDDMLGHTSSSRSRVGEGYSHADRIKLKYNLIKRLKFDEINFNEIRNWQYHKFSTVQKRSK